jgi:hypothetical protein
VSPFEEMEPRGSGEAAAEVRGFLSSLSMVFPTGLIAEGPHVLST